MRALYLILDKTEGKDSFHEAHVIASSPEVAISKAKALLGTKHDLFILKAYEWEATIQRSSTEMSADMNLNDDEFK